jgi:hypothetical protein
VYPRPNWFDSWPAVPRLGFKIGYLIISENSNGLQLFARPGRLQPNSPKFLEQIENALPARAAAAQAGLHIDTVMEWLAKGRKEKTGKFSEFSERYTRARGIAQAKMIERVRLLGREDWRSEFSLLERMFPEDFAKPEVQLNVQANTQVNIGGEFVIDVKGAEVVEKRTRELDVEVEQMFENRAQQKLE